MDERTTGGVKDRKIWEVGRWAATQEMRGEVGVGT